MKQLLYLLIPILILSCSDDDDNTVKAPDYIKVKAVYLDKFPPTDPNRGGWDLLDGADVYFTITYNGNEIYSNRANQVNNHTGSLVWPISGNLNLDYPADQYVIRLYDHDLLDPDDLIGGVNFTPFIESNGRPASINLDCTACTVVFRFDVEYVD